MKIEIYWNAVLGGSMEIFDMMRMGELEIFFGQPMATSDKRFGVWSVPYLFTTEAEETGPVELYSYASEYYDEMHHPGKGSMNLLFADLDPADIDPDNPFQFDLRA